MDRYFSSVYFRLRNKVYTDVIVQSTNPFRCRVNLANMPVPVRSIDYRDDFAVEALKEVVRRYGDEFNYPRNRGYDSRRADALRGIMEYLKSRGA